MKVKINNTIINAQYCTDKQYDKYDNVDGMILESGVCFIFTVDEQAETVRSAVEQTKEYKGRYFNTTQALSNNH